MTRSLHTEVWVHLNGLTEVTTDHNSQPYRPEADQHGPLITVMCAVCI